MDSLNILATFDFEGQKYVITLKSEKIDFYRLENGMFYNNLPSEELDICLEALDNIAIQKETSIYLRNKKVGNNVYQIFYDTKTRLYWWIPITTNEVILEDNKKLSLLYNNAPTVYYLSDEDSSKKEKDDGQTFTIFRKIKNIVVRLVLPYIVIPSLASFSAANIATQYSILKSQKETQELIERMRQREEQRVQELIANYDDEQIQNEADLEKMREANGRIDEEAKKYRTSISEEQTYNWEEIEKAINENQNLTQQEKEFIKKLKPLFDRDNKFMNLQMVIKRLRTLEVTYFEDKIPFSENASGVYMSTLNHIYFADSKSLKDVDEEIIIHELVHMIAVSSSGYSKEYVTDLATKEILLQLIKSGAITPKKEWYDSNGGILTSRTNGYAHDSKLFYLLLNLMDKETRLKYLYQTDERVLAEELIKMDTANDEEGKKRKAYNLVLALAKFKNENKEDTQEYQEYEDEEIFEELNYYYRLKFGHSIEEDFNSVLNFYDNYFEVSRKSENDSQSSYGYSERSYFQYTYIENKSSTPLSLALTKMINSKIPSNKRTWIDDIITAKPQGLFFEEILPHIYYRTDSGEKRDYTIVNLHEMQEEYEKKFKEEYEFWNKDDELEP